MIKSRILSQPARPDWMAEASCVNKPGDLWYEDNPRFHADAKAICRGCPALAACLQWAIETDEREGIWGGHTPRERTNLRRRVDYQVKREAAA